MLLLNFAHPLTPEQLAQLQALLDDASVEVRQVPAHFDAAQPYVPQILALAAACHLSPDEWQSMPILIVPPALNFIAVALLAELHGRMGYFPAVVRLHSLPGSTPPRYEVAEILHLQAIRDKARATRFPPPGSPGKV